MKVSNEIINICPEIKKWRHELHAHPELGYEEEWTSNFVAEKLESFGLEIHRGMAKTGVVGVLKGANHSHGGGGNTSNEGNIISIEIDGVGSGYSVDDAITVSSSEFVVKEVFTIPDTLEFGVFVVASFIVIVVVPELCDAEWT